MRAAILSLAIALAACGTDASQPGPFSPVETWAYDFYGHADCNGSDDVVIEMCFPASPDDKVESGDASAQAYAQVWLATCDVDHAVIGDVAGPSHAGYCANASDSGETTWSCSITYGPMFRTCGGDE